MRGDLIKTKSYLLLFCFLFSLFYSCNVSSYTGPSDLAGSDNTVIHAYPTRDFWAQDFTTNRYYRLTANLLAEGRYCNIWGDNESDLNIVNSVIARIIANFYDRDIYPKMMGIFNIGADIYLEDEFVARNTMELADWMGDGSGKLQILLMDVKDSFNPGTDNTYVAGYFDYRNFHDVVFSNKCAMIYIDTYPSRPGSMESNAVIAHELQHLMNYVNSTFLRTGRMDTWIDEGLSSAAEWVIGIPPDHYWLWYNTDRSGLIQNGNNFFVWGNHNDNQLAIMDDYATVYLFFQWLRLQAGKPDIFRNIISSNHYDYRAITNAAILNDLGYEDWGSLLKTWLAANYINAPNGPYGYMSDPVLSNIQARTVASGITTLSLYPGEGVYSITNNFFLPSNTTDIFYSGLNSNSPALSDTTTYSGGALLTFNANSNITGRPAEGITTGVAGNLDMLPRDRSLGPSGPFRISAGDMLRQSGYGDRQQ